MILCERCANRQNCEYVPYDVECDTRFKDIREDYIGSLSLTAGGFWQKMCTYRLFIEERENYPEECRRLYPCWYYRYDLLCIYKYLQR